LALTPGTRLGVYDIVSLLGSGGMGEVWRAADTRLKRRMPLKVLPAEFVPTPSATSRFQREADALAARPTLKANRNESGPPR
jgi:serine/threonine protein kinase